MTCRQSGKTTTAGIDSAVEALTSPGALILFLSRTERQSEIGLESARRAVYAAGEIPTDESMLRLKLANGSQIIALPGGDEHSIRGFPGVRLLNIDEASFTSDLLYWSASPMIAVSGGLITALGTAWTRQGWFYSAIFGDDPAWERTIVTADDVPRLWTDPDFLPSELRSMGEDVYRREYYCEPSEIQARLWSDEILANVLVED